MVDKGHFQVLMFLNHCCETSGVALARIFLAARSARFKLAREVQAFAGSSFSLPRCNCFSWIIEECNKPKSKNITVTLRANIPYRPHPFYAVHLGISNVRLYIQLGRSTRVFREYKFPTPVKLLHSLTIFNKGLILPPPLNFYIHWEFSIRV